MNIVYENKNRKVVVQHRTNIACEPHLQKEVEILFSLKGRTKAFLNSSEYIIEAGDYFICFPNQVHYFLSEGPEDIFLLIISPEIFPDFLSVFTKKVPLNPLLKPGQYPSELGTIIASIYKFYCSDLEYKDAITSGLINVLFGSTIPLFQYEDILTSNSDMLSNIISYCTQNYTNEINLEKMSKDLHSSKYYISRLFNNKIGMSFTNYLNMLRINDAKEKLTKSELSITEVASAVGYNTIRSFNRAFVEQTSMQPREYRSKNKK